MNTNKKINDYSPKWGFYPASERLNGQGAMILLISIIIIEIFTQKTVVSYLLLR